jgi:hypothetical protein
MTMRSLCLSVAVLAAIGVAGEARSADPDNPDWPCIQRKVPEISAGMVWAGPAVSEVDRSWREDEDRLRLVKELAARRLPLEGAYLRIDDYAAGLGPKKNEALSLLFTGLLQTINVERSEIIVGIERYARRQKALAEHVQSLVSEMNLLLNKDPLEESEHARALELEEQLIWETRIFDEREQSLTYVCESPVLLEQRLFALARHLMRHLEE